MRRRGIVSDEIIQSIDIANTLHGGISEPNLSISQHTNYRQIALRVPGIPEDNMHVKINNNQLVIYYEHKMELRGALVSVPYIVYNKPIPYFIDAKRVSAQYQDGILIVQLPYNELANGYHRDVPIESE